MSKFIRTLNLVKAHRSAKWLTPSQAQALIAIKEVLRVPATANLCGPAGVGKTFLAWVLADAWGYAYFPCLADFSQAKGIAAPGVIIDNVGPSRLSHRSVLKALQLENMKRAVVITRQLIQDYTYYTELSLTEEDWDAVCDNLASVGCLVSESRLRNLWHLVNPTLRGT